MTPRKPSSAIWIGEASVTPLGPVCVAISPHGLTAVALKTPLSKFRIEQQPLALSEDSTQPESLIIALQQIKEMLSGRRKQFELIIDWEGMPSFQQTVLRAAVDIPYGEVCTYGDLARQIGKPGSARAVGAALGSNPMPLVIPCHRVVGADGGLHGYSAPGGLETKAWLLRLEGVHLVGQKVAQQNTLF